MQATLSMVLTGMHSLQSFVVFSSVGAEPTH
jgi:hypothetical protein